MQLQQAEEFVYRPKSSRSRYRDIVLGVLESFDENPEINVYKMTHSFRADADNMRKGINAWKTDEDSLKFNCVVRNKIVYFVRRID